MARTEAQVTHFDPGSTCSRCTASPMVKFSNTALGLGLPFCGHHATKHQPALLEQGFVISVDLRSDATGKSDPAPLAAVQGM